MPDNAAARQRRAWGVLATSAVVLAAHASVLEWAWHGAGHARTAPNDNYPNAVIGATLLPMPQASSATPPAAQAADTATPIPASAHRPQHNRPRTATRSSAYAPATATPAAADTTNAATAPAPAHSASEATASTDAPDTPTTAPTATPAATAPTPLAADATHEAHPPATAEAAHRAPADVQLAAASPGDTQRPLPASASAAPHLPPPGNWHYQVTGQAKGLSYQAEGQLHWQHDGQRYRAHMALRALWLQRTQTSTGTLAPAGLQPEHFIDQARKTRETWFDPQQHTLRAGDGAPQPAPVGVQDRLSVFFQLASQLNRVAAGKAPARNVWPIPVAGHGDSDTWHFEAQGHEPLTLPTGTYDTLKLTRQPRHAADQTVEVWLAPALHHIPVRLRIRQGNGDVVDQQLSGVATAPKP